MKRKQQLGEILLAEKVISRDDLELAVELGRKTGKRLGHVLLEEGILTEEELVRALENQLEMPVADIQGEYVLDNRIFKTLPRKYCLENSIAPLQFKNGHLVIAMADPTKFAIVDEVRFMTDASVDVRLATEKSIIAFLQGGSAMASSTRMVDRSTDAGERVTFSGGSDGSDNLNEQKLAELADDAPVVTLVNGLISEAIDRKASDIHIETYEDHLRIRYRIDGVLCDLPAPPSREMQPAILSRIKIISKLDISERRLPQDGRIGLVVDDRKIDLRVSIVPGVHGENAVLRILDKSSLMLELSSLGFTPQEVDTIRNVAAKPNGMFLVAGPTGSGKTTTLYAILQYIRQFEKKILTIEDPVEYQLDGVTQVQAHAEIGLDFARGLRAFLRHDPDVIMVGEIRDLETAEIAVRSALTGHMVLSTVHTNDSPSAITRFVDMGIPPYMVTATFNMILSQRLIRRICPGCKEAVELTLKRIDDLGLKGLLKIGSTIYKGKGCKACSNSGYQGRFAVFEIMPVGEKVKEMVLKGASLLDIRRAGRQDGMCSLMDQALRKALEGETTVEEALRLGSTEETEFDDLV